MRQREVLEGVAVFVAVAEAGGFSEAARRLGISPSAVSQAVRGLEERLGATLFRRSTRSVTLTDVGDEYLLAAAPALSLLRHAAEEASGRAQRPAGPLRLTMARTAFDLLIAPQLVAFQDRYPDVRLELAVEARLVDIVREGSTRASAPAIASTRTWWRCRLRPHQKRSWWPHPLIWLRAIHRHSPAICSITARSCAAAMPPASSCRGCCNRRTRSSR